MNKNIILAVTGEPGSGKDTFCDFLAEKLEDFTFLKFSDPLTEALKIFHDKASREDQQWLVGQLRQRFGENILGQAIKRKIKKTNSNWIILNGLRKWSEYEMIKNLDGKLIYVTASPKTRWRRLQKREEKADDKDNFNNFLKKEKHSAEADIPKIGKKVDFTVKNEKDLDHLKKEAERIITKLK